jgi:hypothetical protein
VQGILLDNLSSSIVELKNNYMKDFLPKGYVSEVVPCQRSSRFNIEQATLDQLNLFAKINPIYLDRTDVMVDGMLCTAYEGDINNYWLSSKKHDTCYQPFYPTWLLSAYALAFYSKRFGFKELVDIGSGDGRIAYCSTLLGLKAFSIEIDDSLGSVQQDILSMTGVGFELLTTDATSFDYESLDLSCPIFFISGLPESGDILARDVISKEISPRDKKGRVGFNFMGTHMMREYMADKTQWGWGNIIKRFDLEVLGCATLPTLWTNDQEIDTAYVFTQFRQK